MLQLNRIPFQSSLHTEGRFAVLNGFVISITPPRRARSSEEIVHWLHSNLPSTCTERGDSITQLLCHSHISSTPPHGEEGKIPHCTSAVSTILSNHGGDMHNFCLSPCTDQFQSHSLTRRGETSATTMTGVKPYCSIHSPHTETYPSAITLAVSIHSENLDQKQLVVDEVIQSLPPTRRTLPVLILYSSLRYFNPPSPRRTMAHRYNLTA